MRHVLVRSLLAALVLSFLPGTAHAQFGGGWLEKLSGPGPFTGTVFFFPALCYAQRPGDRDPTVFPDWDCERALPDPPYVVIGLDVGHWRTDENDLQYDDRVDRRDLGVSIFSFVPTADWRVQRGVDLGMGLGLSFFFGDAFGTFVRPTWQAFRVTVRPLEAIMVDRDRGRRYGALSVHFNGTVFLKGFDAEDFGAIPGTFDEGVELLPSVSVRVDLIRLLGR